MPADKKTQRRFLAAFAVSGTLLIAIVAIRYESSHTYAYNGNVLSVASSDRYTLIMTDREDRELFMELDPSFIYPDIKSDITYLDEAIGYEQNLERGEIVYSFSDGKSFSLPITSLIPGMEGLAGAGLSKNQSAQAELIHALLAIHDLGRDSVGYFSFCLFGLLFLLFGCGLFFYPYKFWRIQHALLVDGGEPTRAAVICNKAGGIIIAVFVYAGALHVL
ncbi:MAG: hypothetical protein LBU86_05565 [Oscillospiraceae bacterium]|jgi:hypothetical protein|nr:hypothetical protein [Oscillospiraceae bacterium]